jgi:hypothetical protein
MSSSRFVQESNPDDWARFEDAITILQAELANVGAHGEIDAATRAAYDRQVRAMSDELRSKAQAGKVTWKQAATEANAVRNTVMENMRWRSTPVGRAYAQSLKSTGKTLNEMIAKKTVELFGKTADFNALSPVQKNQVYAAVVDSAGQSRPRVTRQMRNVSRAARGLIALSLAVSVYTIATADDKVAAAKEEAAVTGAGIAGGIAGGALAGLACGPGAPVCVGIGAFVGGALAAFGVGLMF